MSEIHGATGSYALNALDPSEVEEFEAHLAVCPTCSREVVEFCETAAQLSLLSSATPPPALRGSILSAISNVRVLPPEPEAETAPENLSAGPPSVPAPPSAVPSPLPVTSTPAAEPQPEHEWARPAAAPVDELALRRARRRTRILSLAVAAATVLALSLGGWVYTLVSQQQSQLVAASAETQLFSAPDVRIVATTMTNGAKVSFISSKSQNKALFVAHDLPAVGSDQSYQLWTLAGSNAIPDVDFQGGGDHKQWFSGTVADKDGVAVTLERRGGSPVPTTPVLASGTV